MGTVRPLVAVLSGLALALAGCGDDPPAKGCDAAYLGPDESCTRGAVVGSVQLQDGDQADTNVSLSIEIDGGGGRTYASQGAGGGPFAFESMDPGTWRLVVSATGYVGHSEDVPVVVGKTTDVGTIVLQPDPDWPASIDGTIHLVGETNHSGTLVWLDDSTLMVSTTPDGAFRFGDVTPGAHVLHARHDGYPPLDHELFLERGRLTVAITLERLAGEGTLSGTVTDSSTSAPVEGATVTVGDTWAGNSGSDGAYKIEGIPPGIYQVKAGRSGFVAAVANGVSIEAESVTRRDFALVAEEVSAKLYGVATRMHAAEGANGGIEVHLSGTPIVTETDASGRWRLDEAPDGRYDVVFIDPRFPPVTVSGVVVDHAPNRQVEDVTLGPAQKIVDGHSTSSRVFATRRKAVVTTTEGTHLFDAARSTSTKLSDEALYAIAVDAEERFATLTGPWNPYLFRLDLEQDTLEPIDAPLVLKLVSDRALTLFVGGDYFLYAIRAGELTPEILSEVDSPSLSMRNLDETRGWMTLRAGGSLSMAVDFDGWIGPLGSQVMPGNVPGMVATVGQGSAGRTIHWSDIGARTTKLVAEGVSKHEFWDEIFPVFFFASTCLFTKEDGSVGALELDTGEVTNLVASSEPPVHWVSKRSLIVRENGGRRMRWVTSDPPSSGILCEDATAELAAGPYHFCLDGPSPHTLRAFVDGHGAETLSHDAVGLPLESNGIFRWNDAGGRLHVRLLHLPVDLSFECAASDATFSPPQWPVTLATCSTQPGTFLLDFHAGEVWHLSAPATQCSVAPDGRLAACSHPCGEETCVRLHDFDAGTSIDVSTSPDPRFVVVWGSDGGVALRTGSGSFHATTGGATPQVTSCGLTDGIPRRVSEHFSLWSEVASQSVVCASDGTNSDLFSQSAVISQIGDSHRYFLSGYLVDLADGSVVHLVTNYSRVIEYSGGVLITTSVGLIRVPAVGAPTWLVEEASVQFLDSQVPWAGFMAGDPSAFDLLVADDAGNVTALVEGGVELVTGGVGTLAFHDEGPDGTSLAIIDSAANSIVLPYRIAGPRQIMGSRIFFDTPTVDGRAFATAHLDTGTSTVLFPTAGGTAIGAGDDGRWIFVADGWSWQETPAESRAVIAGESLRVQSASGGTIVFHATSPDATYWLEGE